MKENKDALLYFRLNCVMLLIVSMLFCGGVFSTYQSYKKYGIEYQVTTIINNVSITIFRSIFVDSLFVLFTGFYGVALANHHPTFREYNTTGKIFSNFLLY